MLSTGIMSAFGFVFWLICSRLFLPADIGVATSLISVASLLTTMSLFGLNNAVVRFLPSSNDRDSFVSSVFGISFCGSIIFSSAFLLWLHVTHNPIVESDYIIPLSFVFILYIIFQTALIIMDAVFIADRKAQYIFGKSVLLSFVKIITPFFLISFGAIGIVYGITMSSVVAVITGFSWLFFATKIKFVRPRMKHLFHIRVFAMGNYFGSMFGILPSSLLPIIILSRLGAVETAYFYIPFAIVTLLNVIPSANAQSLFAEVSNNETALEEHLRKSIAHSFIMLVPAVLVIVTMGSFALSFFGLAYAKEGINVLRILSFASIIGSLNYFGDILLNVKKRSREYIFMNALNALGILAFTYVTAPYGLESVAWGYFVGQLVTMIAYLFVHKKMIKDMIFLQHSFQK
ncbi:MAG: oligosaccharide flippase family protein [Candidatus Yonathbacteria bacterium]|nr:oligosaccharide flippase family protein [Candidatus Yonathbacteria bacterium]NTW47935.1 oligosaccharide flippase family protein [Candidatus Yonathbacteria bacterium]